MDKVQDGLEMSRNRRGTRMVAASHPAAQPCSDLVALCMGLPALIVMLLGFWVLGIL
jgi:hypothetical protein